MRLTLPDLELVEPTLLRAAGEFFCVEYGEPVAPVLPVRWAEGRVEEKTLERGLGSLTMGEP